MDPTASPGAPHSEPVVYRAATDADVPALALLAARTFPLACPPELPPEAVTGFVSENLSEAAFRGYLEAPGYDVVVATPASGPDAAEPRPEVLAYALLVAGTEMDPAAGENVRSEPTTGLSKFYIEPHLRGSGLAPAFLEHLCGLCRDRGDRSLWLGTNVDNAPARAFYDRLGFDVVGERTFDVGGVRCRDVVMERTL